jgi:hypothetical protein
MVSLSAELCCVRCSCSSVALIWYLVAVVRLLPALCVSLCGGCCCLFVLIPLTMSIRWSAGMTALVSYAVVVVFDHPCVRHTSTLLCPVFVKLVGVVDVVSCSPCIWHCLNSHVPRGLV